MQAIRHAPPNLREQGSLLRKPEAPEPVGACPAGDSSRPAKPFASKARSYETRQPRKPESRNRLLIA